MQAQKSTPNLKPNLKVTTSRLNLNKGVNQGVQNISPVGKNAAASLLNPSAKSQADFQFASQLNEKLMLAQKKQASVEPATTQAPGEAELNTLTDSIDGTKVTSDVLKKEHQPIPSSTPQKL